MLRIVLPALVYVATVFAAAFVLGALRVMLVVPRLGELAAVTLEVPVVLGLSWLAMGGMAFALLMLAETLLGITLFGRSLASILATMATLPGLVGLAGQIGFGLVPALRGHPSG